VFLLALPALAHAQDFGILESAETIDKGTFKLRLNPMILFGRNGGDTDFGFAGLLGYGATRELDIEGGVAIYDGVTFFGGNAEYWLIKEAPVDFSIIGGLHRRVGDKTADYNGIDLTFLLSGHATPRFEPYVGLDFAFEGFGIPADYKTVHLVPGFEYKVNSQLDLVAELGLALNDNGRHYFSGGVEIYFK
jgi:hypothetical protein